MMRHDEAKLWQYAADELDDGDRCVVEAHLEDCPECRESLSAVQVARGALDSARRAWPAIEWAATDDAVGALVERQLAANARGPWLGRVALAAALAAAVLTVAVAWDRGEPPAPAPAVAEVTPAPPLVAGPVIRVDRAQGLVRVGREATAVEGGAELAGGDVLRTSLAGKAFVHLPDESHMRVAGGTQLALTRVAADDVALTLERGRIAVRASHAPRRGFAVHTGGLTVHVVGTVFAVSNSGDAVEVAVSEGRVQVDLTSGDVVQVGAGQRIRLDSRSERPQRLAVSEAVARELAELTEVADTATSVEGQAPRALPRLSAREVAQRQAVTPDALTPAVGGALAPAVATASPGDGTPRPTAPAPEAERPPLPTATEVVDPQAGEWAPLPDPRADEWAPLPTPPASRPGPTRRTRTEGSVSEQDLETLFLERATASLEAGGCERFQLGLEDIAQDAARSSRSELARVLRARCFAAQLRPRQAVNEFRKYLGEYPTGRFSTEAREAVGRE